MTQLYLYYSKLCVNSFELDSSHVFFSRDLFILYCNFSFCFERWCWGWLNNINKFSLGFRSHLSLPPDRKMYLWHFTQQQVYRTDTHSSCCLSPSLIHWSWSRYTLTFRVEICSVTHGQLFLLSCENLCLFCSEKMVGQVGDKKWTKSHLETHYPKNCSSFTETKLRFSHSSTTCR